MWVGKRLQLDVVSKIGLADPLGHLPLEYIGELWSFCMNLPAIIYHRWAVSEVGGWNLVSNPIVDYAMINKLALTICTAAVVPFIVGLSVKTNIMSSAGRLTSRMYWGSGDYTP